MNENAIETMLKFLDVAIRTIKTSMINVQSLDEKLIYAKREQELQAARNTLRKEYYAFEDYIETGKYVTPEIKTEK